MIRRTLILFQAMGWLCAESSGQSIPFGNSQDTVLGPDGRNWVMYYYKPSNYDSLSSPILWGIHWTGGTGADERSNLAEMADNRGALAVAPTMPAGGWGLAVYGNLTIEGYPSIWFPSIFRELYKHVIQREKRDSMWVRLIGFSQGGQTVTRYMLLRHAFEDSIPIRMAASVNPFYYTFCTETYNGVCMAYGCGIGPDPWGENAVDFICDEQVVEYYNENYAVLIGTADNGGGGGSQGGCANCLDAQGAGRYQRALNFYNFSTSDAAARGATLKWQYKEFPGVGHDGYTIYHMKADTADTSSITEKILFDSPYYPPVDLPPSAAYYNTVSAEYCNQVSFRARCINNNFPVSVLWDFGDGSTSNEITPVHTYQNAGVFTVTLMINNALGGDTISFDLTIDNLPPQANFSSDTIVYLPDATVQFTNNSTDADFYYWDFGDSIQSNEANPVHTYLYADTFTVTLIAVNGNNGCANEITKTIIVKLPDGIPESSFVASLHVFPNPAKDFVNIRFVLPERSNVQFDLYDITGRFIRSVYSGFAEASAINTIRVQTENLPGGLYLGQLTTARGRKMVKIVVSD